MKCAREICETFVCKHSETTEYVKKQQQQHRLEEEKYAYDLKTHKHLMAYIKKPKKICGGLSFTYFH